MKHLKSTNIISLFIVGLIFSLSMSLALVHAEDDLEDYISQCHAPRALYDPQELANSLVSPDKFLQLISEISKPASAKSMIQCLVTPESRQSVISEVTSPNKIMNAMSTVMTLQTSKNWIASTANMQTYGSLYMFMNPEFYTDWITAMMHPINSQ